MPPHVVGYGDDAIYPMSVSPPVNFSFYKERLQFARSLGMNFVRHHSHILPIEYFDAACEIGIMVSAEFPIACESAAVRWRAHLRCLALFLIAICLAFRRQADGLQQPRPRLRPVVHGGVGLDHQADSEPSMRLRLYDG